MVIKPRAMIRIGHLALSLAVEGFLNATNILASILKKNESNMMANVKLSILHQCNYKLITGFLKEMSEYLPGIISNSCVPV